MHIGSEPMDGSSYGQSALPIMLTRLQCTLEDNSLLNCGRDLYQLSDCDNTRLAGVKCEGN